MNGSSFFPAASYEVQEIFIPEPTIQKIKKQLRPGKHVQADIAAIEKAELTTSGWRYARTAELDKRFTLRDTILPLSIDERNPTMFFSARIHGWNDIKSDKSISDQWLSNIDSVEIPFSLQRRRGLEKSTPEEIQKILRIRREALRKNKKNEENSSG
jgi:hypothetical protein